MKNDQKQSRAEAKAKHAEKKAAAPKGDDGCDRGHDGPGRGGRGRGGRGRGGRGRGVGAKAEKVDEPAKTPLRRRLFEEDDAEVLAAKAGKPAPAKPGKRQRKDKKIADEGAKPVVPAELGWDGREDEDLQDSWPVKIVADPVVGATPMVIRKGRVRCPSRTLLGKLSPKAKALAGRSPSGKKGKTSKPVVRKVLLWQGEDGDLNPDWVDQSTKKRIAFLLSGVASSTFEEVKSHCMAHRKEFKKTQLTAYWTRSAVGLKLILDPCRPQMCTVSFKKEYPNSWNQTMVAAYAAVLKLAFWLNLYARGQCL